MISSIFWANSRKRKLNSNYPAHFCARVPLTIRPNTIQKFPDFNKPKTTLTTVSAKSSSLLLLKLGIKLKSSKHKPLDS
jgi:hypothetical protein